VALIQYLLIAVIALAVGALAGMSVPGRAPGG
jgi:hypothetical protein